ncbi:MAG: hypothetical protein U1G05_05735 [Kiritimatiellia bacterium]
MRAALGISRVVIHRIAFAVSAGPGGTGIQPGPYCANPKSTGAGDRFNAGCCLALALGLDDADALALGCASAGFYVRQARSASQAELVGFLREWSGGPPPQRTE